MQDNDRNTILHLATAGKFIAMVLYLYKIGIEVNALNRKGYRALDVVKADASNLGVFKAFVVCKVVALSLSIGIVNVRVSTIHFTRQTMMKLRTMTLKVMWLTALFMTASYIAAIWTIMPNERGVRSVSVDANYEEKIDLIKSMLRANSRRKLKKLVKYKDCSNIKSVLGLAWNREYRNILAGAEASEQVSKINSFSEKPSGAGANDVFLRLLSKVKLLKLIDFIDHQVSHLWTIFLNFHQANIKTILEFLCNKWTVVQEAELAAPIERVKILNKGVGNCFKRTNKDKGEFSWWRENTANVTGYFPTQALNLAFTDYFRRLLNYKKDRDGYWKWLFVYFLDYARTRQNNDAKAAKKGGERQFIPLIDVHRKTFALDGFTGLFHGFSIPSVNIIVYCGLHFGIYDSLKLVILAGKLQDNFFASFVLGWLIMNGAILTFYLIDIVRKRMTMTSGEAAKYKMPKELHLEDKVDSKGGGNDTTRLFQKGHLTQPICASAHVQSKGRRNTTGPIQIRKAPRCSIE